MTIVAAALSGVCAALVAGGVLGIEPWRGLRTARPASAATRRAWLQEAGLSTTPARFVAWSVALAAASLGVFHALTGSLFVASAPAVAVGSAPRAWAAKRRAHRLRRAQRAWPDALRELLAAVRAGASLPHALAALGEVGPEALRAPFARFPSLASLMGVTAALEVVREELADATSDRVVEVLIVAHERGGSVVLRILEDLVVDTTDDVKLADALETQQLESRINARAVVVLPWAVLVVLTAQEGPFRDFYRGPGGVATLLVGAAMSAVGLAVLGRLAADRPEPRVFGGAIRSTG
jgi:tight adherence protein B